MPSQDDVNKTFDTLLQSMTTRKDDSSSSRRRSIKSIGRRNISSSPRNNRNNDTLQDTDSDDDDNDDSFVINDDDDGSDHHHHHHHHEDSPPSYQLRSIRYNNNPTTPHNLEQSYSTTHPSSTRQHGSNRKKTMKSSLQMLESTYEPEIVNLRSLVEELSLRVTQQSSQVEKYRQELQIVREAKLSGSPHRSSPLRLPRAGLNNNYQGLLESENNNNNNNNYQGNTNNSTVLLDSLDWRIAIGDVSMNLRKDMSTKASREELFTTIRTELDPIEHRLAIILKELDTLSKASEVTRLGNDLSALKHRVSSELTGARFLWTSGLIVDKEWIPWDLQIINAAPSIVQWTKNTTVIKVRMPGLYRLCVAIFTVEPAVLQVYLNDQPMLSYQPELSPNASNGVIASVNNSKTTPHVSKTDRYYLRRLKHPAGEVTCLSIDEYVSLPPDSSLSVKYHSAVVAQGFMSIKKM